MGRIYNALPKKIALIAQEKFDIKTFVDTGATIGTDVSWAAMRFDSVYAIETNDRLYQILNEKTKDFVNVVKFHTPVLQALKDILELIDSPTLFWINDHEPGKECIVLEEIDLINTSPYADVIMVDDASLFDNYDWPTQARVMMSLREHDRRVSYIEDDVIISRPK